MVDSTKRGLPLMDQTLKMQQALNNKHPESRINYKQWLDNFLAQYVSEEIITKRDSEKLLSTYTELGYTPESILSLLNQVNIDDIIKDINKLNSSKEP